MTHASIVKLEDGSQHKNLRVFSASTGEELISFTQKSQEGWDLQYTISESHAIRLVSGEIQVYRPAEWSKGIIDKLKVEGASSVSLSPGLNPSVAVFVAEKKVRHNSLTFLKFFFMASHRALLRASRSTVFSPSTALLPAKRRSLKLIGGRSNGTLWEHKSSSSRRPKSTTRTKATMARLACICSVPPVILTAESLWTRRVLFTTLLGAQIQRSLELCMDVGFQFCDHCLRDTEHFSNKQTCPPKLCYSISVCEHCTILAPPHTTLSHSIRKAGSSRSLALATLLEK